MKLLKNRSGEAAINHAALLLVFFTLLVLAISVYGVALKASKLSAFNADFVRYIEVRGRIDSAVDTEFQRMKAVTGLDVTYSIHTTFFTGDKVQAGQAIEVTVNTVADVGIGGILSIPVPLSNTTIGRSEVYWK